MKRFHPILASIAREHLQIPTLESRRSDHLDFHDVAVWQIEAALKAAFDAGTLFAQVDTESQDEPREEANPQFRAVQCLDGSAALSPKLQRDRRTWRTAACLAGGSASGKDRVSRHTSTLQALRCFPEHGN